MCEEYFTVFVNNHIPVLFFLVVINVVISNLCLNVKIFRPFMLYSQTF